MNFDLSVFSVPVNASEATARTIFFKDLEPYYHVRYGVVPPSPKLASFYDELIRTYPYGESSPWVINPPGPPVGDIIWLCTNWNMVDEVPNFLMDLAAKHQLVVFDPQESGDRQFRLPYSLR